MKDWAKIFEHLKREESAALDMSNYAYVRYAEMLGSHDLAMANLHVRLTSDALEAVRAQFELLPQQIAEDITDPEQRWNWARKLYWGPGCPKSQIAVNLLQCSVERVPDYVGPSPKSLKCIRCTSEFSPDSVEAWRAAFLAGNLHPSHEEWGPVCPDCSNA